MPVTTGRGAEPRGSPHTESEPAKPRAHEQVAGVLLAVTGVGMILSIITNEALYPASRHYSTFAGTISDLSGTRPPNSYMVQPNRAIFILTMALSGLAVLVATYLLSHHVHRRGFVAAMAVFGIGLVGIAVFPGNVATYHPIFALCAFVGGSAAAIASWGILPSPLRYFAATLGATALAATVLGLDSFKDWGPQSVIGVGGIERWIAYPVLLWLVLIGSALMSGGVRPDRGGAGHVQGHEG